MAKLTKGSQRKIALIIVLCLIICVAFGACSTGCWHNFRYGILAAPALPSAPTAPHAPAAPAAPGDSETNAISYGEIGSYTFDPQEVRSLSIAWAAGAATIRTGTDAETGGLILVREEASGSAKGLAPMQVELQSETLSIDYSRPYSILFGCVPFNRKRLEVVLPESAAQSLKRVDLNIASGSYELSGFNCEELDLSMASGTVSANAVNTNNFVLDMASGNASFKGSYGKVLDISMTSGELSVESTANELPATTEVNLMSGHLSLRLPKEPGFTATVDKTSGNFTCSYESRQQENRYIYGNGSCVIDIAMTSGSVELMPVQ